MNLSISIFEAIREDAAEVKSSKAKVMAKAYIHVANRLVRTRQPHDHQSQFLCGREEEKKPDQPYGDADITGSYLGCRRVTRQSTFRCHGFPMAHSGSTMAC